VVLQRNERLIELEAVRGIAACVVLVHHCLLGFAPTLTGLVGPTKAWSLFGTPLFALVNGSAAVVIFFVLSGFVLTYRAIESKDTSLIWLGAAKRWPRLAVPVLAVNIIAALIATMQLYRNVPASSENGSIWLSWFYRDPSPYFGSQILGAVYEGGVDTFLFGGAYFNANLWTMYYELVGSFFVFGLAYLFLKVRANYSVIIASMATAIAVYFSPYFLCFATGITLAIIRYGMPAAKLFRWSGIGKPYLGALGIILTIFLLGYHEHIGSSASMRFYEFLSPVADLNPLLFRVVLHTLGAVIILVMALKFPGYLRTTLAALVGRLSFPTYLLHIPLICSIGSYLYLLLLPVWGEVPTAATTVIVTITVTFAAAFPLAYFDRFWLITLRRFPIFVIHQFGPMLRQVLGR
jgi:peptidoglycan/LPS O-acetylase OafA/YrhL